MVVFFFGKWAFSKLILHLESSSCRIHFTFKILHKLRRSLLDLVSDVWLLFQCNRRDRDEVSNEL